MLVTAETVVLLVTVLGRFNMTRLRSDSVEDTEERDSTKISMDRRRDKRVGREGILVRGESVTDMMNLQMVLSICVRLNESVPVTVVVLG